MIASCLIWQGCSHSPRHVELSGDVVTSEQIMGAVNERVKNQEGGSAQQGGLFTAGNADTTESRAKAGGERQGSSAERTNGPDREQPEKPAVPAWHW